MNIINLSNDKIPLTEYLNNLKSDKNKKIGLIFKHGVGDILMFLPYFDYIKSLYKQFEIHLLIIRDYEEQLYEKRLDLIRIQKDDSKNALIYNKYDYLFQLKFREGTISEVFYDHKFTKPEFCLHEEIGFKNFSFTDKTLPTVTLQHYTSKYIGFTFNRVGEGFTEASNVPYNLAKYMWFKTKQLGYIPIEILFLHPDYIINPSAKIYDFVDRTTRDILPNFENTISILSTLRGYVTIDCGLFHIAYNYFNHKNILYLQLTAPINYLTKFTDIPNFNFLGREQFDDQKFINWMKNCDGSLK